MVTILKAKEEQRNRGTGIPGFDGSNTKGSYTALDSAPGFGATIHA